jgi:hypothetical protein
LNKPPINLSNQAELVINRLIASFEEACNLFKRFCDATRGSSDLDPIKKLNETTIDEFTSDIDKVLGRIKADIAKLQSINTQITEEYEKNANSNFVDLYGTIRYLSRLHNRSGENALNKWNELLSLFTELNSDIGEFNKNQNYKIYDLPKMKSAYEALESEI